MVTRTFGGSWAGIKASGPSGARPWVIQTHSRKPIVATTADGVRNSILSSAAKSSAADCEPWTEEQAPTKDKLDGEFDGFLRHPHVSKTTVNQCRGVLSENITIVLTYLATMATLLAVEHTDHIVEAPVDLPSVIKLAGKFVAFFILSSVFVEDREMTVALTYLVGLVGTCFEFFQKCAFKQYSLACFALMLVSLGIIVSVKIDKTFLRTRLWKVWRQLGAVLGFSLVAQVSAAVLNGSHQVFGAGYISLCLGVLGVLLGILIQSLLKRINIRQDLGAWSATIIFMLLSVDDAVGLVLAKYKLHCKLS